MIPPYPGSNTRARDRVQALQAYYQRQQPSNSPAMRTPIIPGNRRSGGHRGIPQIGPVPSSSDQTNGFYFFPSGTSGRNYQEADNLLSSRFHAWERDPSSSFSMNQVDRDTSWGGYHQPTGGSDSGIRPTSLRRRHGPERTWSQNQSEKISFLCYVGASNILLLWLKPKICMLEKRYIMLGVLNRLKKYCESGPGKRSFSQPHGDVMKLFGFLKFLCLWECEIISNVDGRSRMWTYSCDKVQSQKKWTL